MTPHSIRKMREKETEMTRRIPEHPLFVWYWKTTGVTFSSTFYPHFPAVNPSLAAPLPKVSSASLRLGAGSKDKIELELSRTC
jgi:hypothetical protein